MRVVAVVVTFNRLSLLRRLVERLQTIAEVDEIVVVDNASTDGTGEWLASRYTGGSSLTAGTRRPSETDTRRPSETGTRRPSETGTRRPSETGTRRPSETGIRAEILDSNRGGAGGFHHGLATAIGRGADLVWLMDDDGLPEPGCLATLLAHDDLDFWGPLVVDEADPERLVFPIRLPGGTRVVHDTAAAERAATGGVLSDIVIPFNGVLVTRDLVDRIGLPRSEFFIWGDDHEYRLRAEAAGARIATITDARVHHPAVGDLGTPMMFGRTTYNHSPSDLKHYCMARNNTLNLRDHRGWLHVLLFWLKTVWFYLFTRPRPGRIPMSARAAYDGLRGDFSGHERFLP